MKKILIFMFLFSLIFLCVFSTNKSVCENFAGNQGICEFFCNDVKENNKFILSNISTLNGNYVSCNIDCANIVSRSLEGVKGFKIVFFQKPDLSNLNIQILKSEYIDDMKIIYGFSNLLSNSVFIDGKKVNVQIVERQDEFIFGSPLILSSY